MLERDTGRSGGRYILGRGRASWKALNVERSFSFLRTSRKASVVREERATEGGGREVPGRGRMVGGEIRVSVGRAVRAKPSGEGRRLARTDNSL